MNGFPLAILVALPLVGQTTQPRIAQRPTPQIARFLETCETSRRGAITQLEFELRGLKNSLGRHAADSARATTIEKNLQSLRENRELVIPELHFPPQVE